MTQTDFMSWRMEEDPILRSTIIAVAVLDESPDWGRFVRMMDRGTRAVPIFRRKAVGDSIGLAPPHWTDDPDFDLSWHLRRFSVSAPSGWAAVLDFARITGMTAFDKSRPLWEFTVIEGLEEGRSALVMKVHHSLTDGVSGMQIAREIVDFARAGTERAALPDSPPPEHDRAVGALQNDLAWHWRTGVTLTRRVAAFARAESRTLRMNPITALREMAAVVGSTARFVRPVVTTLSPVMTKRSTRRHFAVFDVPMESLCQAATLCGCSLNDAFLASIMLGMQHYHRSHGAEIPELKMTLPISLRTDADPLGGNRITLARFSLPLDVDDPAELMRRIDSTVEAWRDEPAVPLSSTIAGVLNLLPASTLGNMLKHVDFVASNVVGSPIPLYVAGAQITRYYAFSPTLGSAFNVTLMSYTSHCCVGIDADADAVPDLAAMTVSLAEGFRAVLRLCTDPESDTVVANPARADGDT
ncbi:wax ester/triacylglycerol synthase domain-containing protein [Rhodococcus jostii]|nr:wax ester/triacylglycerol synthase domain-containing protein [Rhodococcus jostii]